MRCAAYDPGNGVDALRGAGFTMEARGSTPRWAPCRRTPSRDWEGWSFSLNATAGTNPEPRTELALSLLEPAPEPEPTPEPTPEPDPQPSEPADVAAAVAPITIQDRDANAWGTVDGRARVSTQVRLPDGMWSTSQTRDTDDGGAFVIPLTYGRNSAGTLHWRVRVVHDDGTVQYSEPMVQTRLARTTSAVARLTVAGRDANLWGNVAGPATISTQVRLPEGTWSTSQTRRSNGGFYAIPLTYGKSSPGSLQWRARVVHANGMVEYGPALTQQRVQRPSVGTAGSKPVGQHNYAWGRVDVDRPTRVFTHVFVDGAWSRSQVAMTTASGHYTIELTYGKHQGGTYRYRIGAQLPGIGTVFSDEFVLVRTVR